MKNVPTRRISPLVKKRAAKASSLARYVQIGVVGAMTVVFAVVVTVVFLKGDRRSTE